MTDQGDCIFCKIIKGDIPCNKIYENDKVVAFLDIQPINKGHTLLIPKPHHRNVFDLPEEFLVECAKAIKPVARAVKEATNADGINIGMNNEKAAGQAVWHAHFHVIPRFLDDGLKPWPGKTYGENESKAMAEKIAGLVKTQE